LLEAGAIDGARGILINITGSTSLKLAEVQQACSIIQEAAHEEANIIFGAVLDEKMKDSVKITVIATGFREIPQARNRHQETRISFAAAHEDDFAQRDPLPDPIPPQIMSDTTADTRSYVNDGVAVPAVQPADRVAADVVSLETMRSAMVNNFEQNDLDVPAFLRKRNDVM
jgi:cell division protein FtsZ